ncbi:MAG TPA: hypothetical protein VGL86_15815 [Polyangia bacterium]
MVRSLLIACALVGPGCAGRLQAAEARHDANALALDGAGQHDAALREREKAEHARERLQWQDAAERKYVPPLTAFYR